ncbi:conjugal transfer protein TrbC [Shewanella sairae]|uniref:Conjugal transfer protein TrbC n=1 Tax=Shewanella sairae TaxID=190310 RepID=A0ABQ4PS63_9GAMM|nr:TrbC/VirB2 family protein [Shewanella sairae]MCL1132587.1 TrbC/VirB2 family protein [Shewanella sairae]GIU52412.1 conjugal transfer protein TrbC [Shewanella sairae]
MLHSQLTYSPNTPFKPPLHRRALSLLTEHPFILMVMLFAVLLLFPDLAHASSTNMPWEAPLTKLVNSVTGPVAFGISVLALVASIAGLVFGGEISGLIKTMLFLALGISVIVFATNMLRTLFGISSTLIG